MFDLVLFHAQRRASARTVRNSPNRITERKNPKSEVYIAPVANGVKRARRERPINQLSTGDGSKAARESIAHKMPEDA